MEITCSACDQTLTVTSEQIGQSIRCPSCQVVLQVQQPGAPVSDTLVTCPGCSSKLAIPEATDAATFRCPKCATHLATPKIEPEAAVDVWASAGASANATAGHAAPSSVFDETPQPHGFGVTTVQPVNKPVTSSSTQWKKKTAYSSKVASVVPGALLLVHALLALLLNVIQFFYAMGFSDDLMAEQEVQVLRTFMIASSVLGSLYLLVIVAGSVHMIIRQRLWFGRLACIFAVLPLTALVCGPQWLCVTSLMYPLALVAGIWGLIVLFGHHAQR